jgi:hypothetical protein
MPTLATLRNALGERPPGRNAREGAAMSDDAIVDYCRDQASRVPSG